MNKSTVLLALGLAAMLSGTEAIAQNQPAKTITVGVYQNDPKVFIDSGGRARGFWVDITSDIGRVENWAVTYVPCEWNQCLQQIEQGQLDLMVDVAYSDTRDEVFDFNTIIVLSSWSQIYARRGVYLETILDLDQRRVSILASGIQQEVLRERIKAYGIQPELVPIDSYPGMFEQLETGEVDAAIVNNFFGNKFSPDYPVNKTNILFNPARLHYVVPEGDPKQLLPGIDRQMSRLLQDRDSVYYQAIAQWLEPPETFNWLSLQNFFFSLIVYLPFLFLGWFILRNYSLKKEIKRRNQIETNLLESQQRYANLANTVSIGIFRTNLRHECIYVNDYYCKLLAIQPEEALHKGWLEKVYPDDIDYVREQWLKSITNQELFTLEYRFQRSDGSILWVYGQGTAELDSKGEPQGYVATITDISTRIKMEQQLKHDALHDRLTGLANRNLLIERLNLALKRYKRYPIHEFAALFLDLDNFKVVNDSLGHVVGDELLIEVAHLLKSFIRDTDVAARLGGDEFVILLEEIHGVEDAVHIADRILNALNMPFQISNYGVFITTSIGIIIGDSRHESAQDLLRDADIAMYRAKQNGKSQYAIFDPQMHLQAMQRLQLEGEIRSAIEEKQFVLYYQPIINLEQGNIEGFEALIRWQHPQRGLLSPYEFIDVAEETGLIIPLGEWILDAACRQLFEWQQAFKTPLKVHVNLSVKQLQDSLLFSLDRLLERYPVFPNTLGLEITESMLIQNIDITCRLLNQIRLKGVFISVDDFGTGYSCLSYLHQLPIDALKIDRSFVNISELNDRNRVIAESILALSKSIGIKTVAEGIETKQQYQWLKSQDCQFGQGYLFSRPVSLDQATDLLQGHSFEVLEKLRSSS
ncbi:MULTISPECIES: EAL domain-containing protein [Cyanophyceae]|uniref:EAL domain-containing protein n=1 Tax=Cyanophyceae TaxID=3028117 RepID=UPI00016DC91F|nr:MULTISPECIES: EAL domain-containing protein [Cyanophyceae]ACB00439.1 two-component response regulator (ABC transporter) / (GGDEF domain protein) [Picosynechococcus sp. PCC 7002]SMH49341.1 periplasmic sensor diguanylate cyclase/phosphodiesterase [Picosynechococcus sp. OG1]SMQ81563.1 periplasmic sensor diguanylate cyclase/phosphodiesterase [Synechococcus sp. 7002]